MINKYVKIYRKGEVFYHEKKEKIVLVIGCTNISRDSCCGITYDAVYAGGRTENRFIPFFIRDFKCILS